MSCKNRFPFRIGTTSYIIPDDILPNIEYLKHKVDDVELVLFESDEISNLPSPETVSRLKEIGDEHDLTYSIHLPLDVYLGSDDSGLRERSVDKCLRVIELTGELDPSAYVMHAEAGPGIDVNRFTKGEQSEFAMNVRNAIERLLSAVSVQPSEFCIETLNYPLEIIDVVISSLGLAVTLDIGHLELYGYPVREHLERYIKVARVLHVHGIEDGRDHRGLQHMRPETLAMVMQALLDNRDRKRIFTMEIFSKKDFDASCVELMKYVS